MATPTSPRVHELAKRLGVGTKELRERASAELGLEYGNHMKRVTPNEEAKIVALFQPAEAAKGRLVRELAKDLGVTNRVVLDAIAEHHADWGVKSHGKRLTPEQDAAVVALLGAAADAPAAAEAVDEAPKKKRSPRKKAAPKADAATTEAAATAADEAGDEAPKKKRAPRKKAAPKSDAAAEAAEAATDEAPKKKRAPRKKKADDDGERAPKGRRDKPAEITIDLVEAARDYLRPILTGMGVPRVRIDGHVDGNHLDISISGYGVEALIGSANAAARTDVVEALEVVSHRALSNAAGDSIRVRIDVNGFRAGRRDAVAAAASRLAEWVRRTGRSVQFAGMNSFDRYAFHKALGRDRGVSSESDGHGVFRRLGVYPRD